jgi:hypothetical protein
MTTIRIFMGPQGSPQTVPLETALRNCRAIGLIKDTDIIETKTLKQIRDLRWSSKQFISWGRGDDQPAGQKLIFIMAGHPLQLDDPPAWDHLQHLKDMREKFRGTLWFYNMSKNNINLVLYGDVLFVSKVLMSFLPLKPFLVHLHKINGKFIPSFKIL